MSCNRRDFLKLSAVSLAATLIPVPSFAIVALKEPSQRRLAFYNTHTRESLDVCYYRQGAYCPDALARIDRILRDHRTREIQPIDRRLLDILFTVKSQVRQAGAFHIISGYRSPATNEMLRQKSSGVARTSYHTKGQAVDIRLAGYNSRRLRQICADLKFGGVGYYPESDFVHLDTGPVRSW